jgi:outer membrane lipoprotein-sorting protein
MLPLLALVLCAADPTGADIVQKSFEDATFVARVVQSSQSELAKVTKDFGQSYRFKTIKAYLKEPLKMRLEAQLDDTDVQMVIVDFARYFLVPRAKIRSKEDLKEKPGKMQSPLDYGIVSPGVLKELFQAKYVRTDRASGDYVFDLTYHSPRYADTSRHRVWVDPKKRVVNRREWYAQDGRQLATFLYEKPMLRDGVWFPTRGLVRNMDGKIAGVIQYDSVKINSGLADSLFQPGS